MDFVQDHWVALISLVATVLVFMFHLGGRVYVAQGMIRRINLVEKDTLRKIKDIESRMDERFTEIRLEANVNNREIETKISAVDAKYLLTSQQQMEYREIIGRTYATNARLDIIEARFTAAVDRLMDKFDLQSTQILDAIRDLNRRP